MALAVVSALQKLRALLDDGGVCTFFKKKFQMLKQSFDSILQDVEMAEAKEISFTNEETREWINCVRDVAYDAEDLADEFRVKMINRKTDARPRISKIPLLNQIIYRYEFAMRIVGIKQRLHKITKEKNRFSFKRVDSQKGIRNGGNRSFMEIKSGGRDADMVVILDVLLHQRLMDDSKAKFSVVSIVGIGGLGKTRLANIVFNDESVGNHFEKTMWVVVSKKPDVAQLAREVLEAVINSTVNDLELDSVCERIAEELSCKRFLLVLDEVWDLDWWSMLEPILRKGATGSRIFITTRDEDVALRMQANYVHKLGFLSFDESWNLFLEEALREGESEADLQNCGVRHMGEVIVRECKGLPLAIKVVGTMMKSMDRSPSVWGSVAYSTVWKTSPCVLACSDVLSPLMLSYNHLPAALKRCFVYCTIFPEGCCMEREHLKRLWMAEDFIGDGQLDDVEPEDIANDYLDALLSHCLIQGLPDGKLKLHDLVHSFAKFIAKNEYSSECIDRMSRRLSWINKEGPIDHLQLQETGVLRTLLCPALEKVPFDCFYRFKRLRVLDIGYCGILGLPEVIGDMVLLKYLNISHTKIKKLPKSIGKLSNLQTLDLTGSQIEKLPKRVGQLQKLRQLELRGTYRLAYMAGGLGKLTCLRTLTKFILCDDLKGRERCNIKDLRNLKNLHGSLSIEHLERLRNKDDARACQLQQKRHIVDLEMGCGVEVSDATTQETDEEMAKRIEEIFEELQPPMNLEKLRIICYLGKSLKHKYSNLKTLILQGCKFLESLPDLFSVSNLYVQDCRNLQSLSGMAVINDLRILEIKRCQRLESLPCMPSLEDLVLEYCGNLPTLPGMPRLLNMKINGCKSLNSLPWLPKLKKMKVERCDNLQELPHLASVTELDIGYLSNWKISYYDEGTMPNLLRLKIKDCQKLKVLPPLKTLIDLDIYGCQSLHTLPCLPSIKYLQITKCKSLHAIWETSEVRTESGIPLESLRIRDCPKLRLFWACLKPLSKLEKLDLSWFPEVSVPPDDTRKLLQNLRSLTIRGCPQHDSLPSWVQYLCRLQQLHIENLTELTSLQGPWSNLQKLEVLEIRHCLKLISIEEEGLQHLTQLKSLIIENLPQLVQLPEALSVLQRLKSLCIRNCPKIRCSDGLRNHFKAEKIHVYGSPILE